MARDAEQACSTHQCLGGGSPSIEQDGDNFQVPILACDEQGRGAITLQRSRAGAVVEREGCYASS
jgi:hypothetical protein